MAACERAYWIASATDSVTHSTFPSRSRKWRDTFKTATYRQTPPTSGHAQCALRWSRTGQPSYCAVHVYFRQFVDAECVSCATASVWRSALGARVLHRTALQGPISVRFPCLFSRSCPVPASPIRDIVRFPHMCRYFRTQTKTAVVISVQFIWLMWSYGCIHWLIKSQATCWVHVKIAIRRQCHSPADSTCPQLFDQPMLSRSRYITAPTISVTALTAVINLVQITVSAVFCGNTAVFYRSHSRVSLYSALTTLNADPHNSCASMGNNIVSGVENAPFSHQTLRDIAARLSDD